MHIPILGSSVERLKVSVKYSDYRAGIFQGFYRPDQTLYDVIADMCKKENGEKVEYQIYNDGIKMNEDTQISFLCDKRILDTMTAVVKLSKSANTADQ